MPFEGDRARNIVAAERYPISTLLRCRFSDLRDWLTRTSSHVSNGQVSNEINHGYVGTSIPIVSQRNSDAPAIDIGDTSAPSPGRRAFTLLDLENKSAFV